LGSPGAGVTGVVAGAAGFGEGSVAVVFAVGEGGTAGGTAGFIAGSGFGVAGGGTAVGVVGAVVVLGVVVGGTVVAVPGGVVACAKACCTVNADAMVAARTRASGIRFRLLISFPPWGLESGRDRK
jgi:hypothetical protein